MTNFIKFIRDFSRTFLLAALTFTLTVPLHLIPYGKREVANAQGFNALFTPNGAAQWSERCYEINSIIEIILVFDSFVTLKAASETATPVTGALIALTEKSDLINKICTLVLAFGTARDMKSTLSAVKTANRLGVLGLTNEVEKFEAAMSFYDFTQNLKNSNQSTKSKLLNANNYRRILQFSFDMFPLDDYNARKNAHKRANELTRSSLLAQATEAFMGCREYINPARAGEITLSDGTRVKASEANEWSRKMIEKGKEIDKMAGQITTVREHLISMVAEVTTRPEDIRIASTALDRYIRDGIWVAIGYNPPPNATKTRGAIGVKETPGAKNLPGNLSPADGGGTVNTKLKKTQTVEDLSSSFYSNQGFRINGCNNRDEYRFENWVNNVEKSEILRDPFIYNETIAAAVQLCPSSSPLSALRRFEFAPYFHATDSKEAIAFRQKQEKTIEENCRKRNIDALFQEMDDLKGLANGYQNFGRIDTSDECKITEKQRDSIIGVNVADLGEITNMHEFREFYGKKFGSYVDRVYGSSFLENNDLTNSQKAFSRSLAETMRGSDNSYGTANSWNPEAANRIGPTQLSFIKKWRASSINLCFLPSHLKNKYGRDTPDNLTVIGNPESNREAYAGIVRKCEAEQNDPEQNKEVFFQYFDAFVNLLYDYHTARRDVTETEIRAGLYKGPAFKPAGCRESMTPADIQLASAKMLYLNYMTLEDQVRQLETLNQHYQSEEKKKRDEAQARELEIIQAIAKSRETEEELSKRKFELGSNPGYEYKNFAPSIIEVHKQDELGIGKIQPPP